MILSSVIIVLGEVLEVALLTSLFLALSFRFKISRYWIIYAIAIGSTSAVVYAIFFDIVSLWLDGFGQEVVNTSILIGIYICLLIFNTLIHITNYNRQMTKYLPWVMTAAVSLALTREVSEIFLYLSGFFSSKSLLMPVITGSILGASIGLSFGILVYYIFIHMSNRTSLYVGYSLLLFVAAGMVLQAVRLLIQIDWLPAQKILWDVSGWLDESSVMGRLLFTLVGYEATPTLIEIQCYIAAVLLILITTSTFQYYFLKKSSGS